MILSDYIPELFWTDDPNKIISPLLDAWQSFRDDTVDPAIASMRDLVNADLTTEIDILLKNFGNPFPIVMTTEQKRRLARTLVRIYRMKGTRAGIAKAILFFTSFPVTIVDMFSEGAGVGLWELGISELGLETVIGPDMTGMDPFTFLVIFSDVVDATTLANADTIIRFMAPGWTRWYIQMPNLPLTDTFEDASWV